MDAMAMTERLDSAANFASAAVRSLSPGTGMLPTDWEVDAAGMRKLKKTPLGKAGFRMQRN
jgi:hypothetical protein